MNDTTEYQPSYESPASDAAAATPRPWHGSTKPFDALHDWIIAEFAKKGGASDEVKALSARVTALESENSALKAKDAKIASDVNPSAPPTNAYAPPYVAPGDTTSGATSGG